MHKHALNALVPLQTRVNHTEPVSNGCNGHAFSCHCFKFVDDGGISPVTGRSRICIWEDSGSSCGAVNNSRINHITPWRKLKLKLGSGLSPRSAIRLKCIERSSLKILVVLCALQLLWTVSGAEILL
jgi:hypothetical protein